MWRSNGSRVRSSWSLATTQRSILPRTRWYSARALEGDALAISNDEFASAFEGVVDRRSWAACSHIGLAVSGGVDSMALATLYNEYRISTLTLNGLGDADTPPELHGFVVDHKKRPESTEEAEWVAEQLRSQFKISTSIIPLIWPAGFHENPDRFESEARTLRFQALGRACRDRSIRSLMVAHHADDQAEIIMMRLVAKRHRSGLRAMQKADDIPECEGIYGASRSGSPQQLSLPKDFAPFQIEGGGIRVVRPLIDFHKRRLIATCKHYGTSWTEDKTNQDQTLTQRNAVRHIVGNHALPQALSNQSLVGVAERMQARVEARLSFAEQLFERMPLKLDLQTGSLVARIPPVASLLPRPISSSADRAEAADNAHCLLMRLMRMIVPKSRPAVGRLAGSVDHVWPELISGDNTVSPKELHHEKYTVGGMIWQPLEDAPDDPSHGREWLLSRERPQRSELGLTALSFPQTSPSGTNSAGPQWHLFDNRYWIRVQNKTDKELVMRFMSSYELGEIYARHHRKPGERGKFPPIRTFYVRAALSLIKPHELLTSVPVIFMRSSDGIETPILLPTFNLHLVGKTRDICDWEIRYKNVDWGKRRVVESLVPGMTEKDIVANMSERIRAIYVQKYKRDDLGFPKKRQVSPRSRVDKMISKKEKAASPNRGTKRQTRV
ncbi:unnamed protein product [Periconia digitata]|uniref:tRNA(Ile)-lysidine synthetase n=1 Tax=Periconia digitata TaxID=1303443 RepID=A0A9W4XDP9_9PLEO|nr:unnamed protein product [Periconia digitata]